MLNHQVTGAHYACSTSQLADGNCQERTTKSGAIVKVCSCSSSDFCNQKLWPADVVQVGSTSHSDTPSTGFKTTTNSGPTMFAHSVLWLHLLSTILIVKFLNC
uniref:UPAR/Ly6 domain-containing protein n=1 Tax=Syphacia muris TaxID=451379 RepID=A0A0N5B0X2_9BILA